MDPAELIEAENEVAGVQGRDRAPARRRPPRLPDRPLLRGALVAAASYAGLRAGIAGFHRLRRRFLRSLLLDVSAALAAAGATHWLDFGCLLGLTRGGDLIPYDNDVDVAVLMDPRRDWAALLPGLKRRLEPHYSVKVVTPGGGDPSCGAPWVRVYCPLGMADLFAARAPDSPGGGGEPALLRIDCGHGVGTHIPADLVLPTGSMEWRGARLAVPKNVEGVLAARYGPDWRVPHYMDKGADEVEGSKLYARLFRALAAVGIRV